MIDQDPHCANCGGTGVHEHLPCRCRFEPNNCDRCATLQCGEERAPSSRWNTQGAHACLCDGCRAELKLPRPVEHMTRDQLIARVLELEARLATASERQ